MSYVETVKTLTELRQKNVSNLGDAVKRLFHELLEVESKLEVIAERFHADQLQYRLDEWHEITFRLPGTSGSSMVFSGPFLSSCTREERKVIKRRVSRGELVRKIVGKDFVACRTRYVQLGEKLSAISNLLDVRIAPRVAAQPKGMRRAAFVADRLDRLERVVGVIGQLGAVIDSLDEKAEEAILAFNDIEGSAKRYGSLLSRWELPSRIPSTTLSGPVGPKAYFIAFNRTHRMTKPLEVLYQRVHARTPKEPCPLTRQMAQRSRLGRIYKRYREAYRNLVAVREERDAQIEILTTIKKYAR